MCAIFYQILVQKLSKGFSGRYFEHDISPKSKFRGFGLKFLNPLPKLISLNHSHFQDGYEYATTNQLEFELCDGDVGTVCENGSENPTISNGRSTESNIQQRSHTELLQPRLQPTLPQQQQHQPVNQCVECHKKFPTSHALAAHMNTHSGPKLYSCNQCDASFDHRPNLWKHRLVVHREVRPYGCHLCKRQFSCQSTLNYHMNTHINEKSCICNLCGKSYSNIVQLTNHKEFVHHIDGNYWCKVCGRSFLSIMFLKKHLRIAHDTENFVIHALHHPQKP